MATKRLPHFVIVRTTAGYHVRLVGANGQPVYTTEPYRETRRARRAIALAAEAVLATEDAAACPVVDERPKA